MMNFEKLRHNFNTVADLQKLGDFKSKNNQNLKPVKMIIRLEPTLNYLYT